MADVTMNDVLTVIVVDAAASAVADVTINPSLVNLKIVHFCLIPNCTVDYGVLGISRKLIV